MKNIEIVKGDITELYVDAIVNVANNSLLGGGGVDGAIHKKVGAELDKECVELNGCMTGEAKITKGYNLNANYIIHTVAPKYFDNRVKNKEELLRSCYVNSYKLAEKYNLKTIAFPCLGMGVYRVHLDIGKKISIEEAINNSKKFKKIYLGCFGNEEYEYYKKTFKEVV